MRLDLDRYVGHRVHLEFIPEADKQIAVRLAVQGLSKNELATLEEQINEGDQKYEEYAKTAEAILNNDPQPETDLYGPRHRFFMERRTRTTRFSNCPFITSGPSDDGRNR